MTRPPVLRFGFYDEKCQPGCESFRRVAYSSSASIMSDCKCFLRTLRALCFLQDPC